MKSSEIILPFLCIFVMYACGGEKVRVDNVTYFTEDDFAEIREVKTQMIPLPEDELKHPESFHVIRDSLFLIENMRSDNYYVQLYDMNGWRLLAQTARMGNGPGEYLSIMGAPPYGYEQNNFILYDIDRREVAINNIDSLLKYKEKYVAPKFSIPYYGYKPIYVGDSVFLAHNKFYMRYAGFNEDIDCLFYYRAGEPVTPERKYRRLVWTGNYNQGQTFVHPLRDTVFFVYYCEDRIEMFLKKDLSYIGTLRGPDNFMPRYKIKDGILNRDIYCSSYDLGTCNDDYIYLLHNPESEYSSTKSLNTEVFKLSWDGKLQTVYRLDYYVNDISPTSDKTVFYATGCRSYKQMHKLFRIVLD